MVDTLGGDTPLRNSILLTYLVIKLAGREMAATTVYLEEDEFGHPLGTRKNYQVSNVDRKRRLFESSATTQETVTVKIKS